MLNMIFILILWYLFLKFEKLLYHAINKNKIEIIKILLDHPRININEITVHINLNKIKQL